MKTTTLRQLIKEDLDFAFSLMLYYFCNYEHSPNLVTTDKFAYTIDRSKGYYGPYNLTGINKEFLDLPLYLGE
jgi:hypothetical protein